MYSCRDKINFIFQVPDSIDLSKTKTPAYKGEGSILLVNS